MGKNEKSEKKGSHLDRCSRFISLCVYERRRLRGFRFIPRMRAARCRHKHHEVVEVERGVREPPVDEEDVVDAEEDEPRPPDTSAPRPRGALAAVLRSDFMIGFPLRGGSQSDLRDLLKAECADASKTPEHGKFGRLVRRPWIKNYHTSQNPERARKNNFSPHRRVRVANQSP